ncbi:MAG: DMT family transporter [Actinobacteria bacterium]|nr:DMT family transporter [Actinomycetota bacterium]
MRRVLALAGIWGWSFLFIKVAVRGLTPPTVAFTRVFLGMVVMLCVLRSRGLSLPRDRRTWRHFLVMGAFYSAVPFTLLAWGEERVTSALAAVVNASTPLFAALAGAVVLSERLRRPQLAGLLLGFVGVGVAAGMGGHDLASSSMAGVGAVMAASACYGYCFAYAQRHLAGVPPLVAACGQLVAATVVTAPFALASTAASGISLNGRIVVSMVLLGAVGTGFAYLLNYRVIAEMGATLASLVTYLVPVVAVTVGVLFLGEPFRVRLVLGGALIVLGIALLQERLRRFRRAAVAGP